MLTFLFWNIDKRPILDRAARIAVRRGVDVLCSAECAASENDVLAALASAGGSGWTHPPVRITGRAKTFTRLTAGTIVEHLSTSNGRLTVREVRPGGRGGFVMAAVHLTAKSGGWTDFSQASAARTVAEAIERMERQLQNPRTLVIGDLNMPPSRPD